MKKLVFILVVLFLFLSSYPASSQMSPVAPAVRSSVDILICRDDVCAMKVTLIVKNLVSFSAPCIIEYHFLDKSGLVVSSFQTELFVLLANEEKILEQTVMMDKARLETVKSVKPIVKFFLPGSRGYGRGPGYWMGVYPRAF